MDSMKGPCYAQIDGVGGERFIDERYSHARTADACLPQPDQEVYLICDNQIFDYPEFQMQTLIDARESVADMERDLGLSECNLQQTISRYNKGAAQGKDPEQYKHQDWLHRLAKPRSPPCSARWVN